MVDSGSLAILALVPIGGRIHPFHELPPQMTTRGINWLIVVVSRCRDTLAATEVRCPKEWMRIVAVRPIVRPEVIVSRASSKPWEDALVTR